MRRRDARDLAALAQDALRELAEAPNPGEANTAQQWQRWARSQAGTAVAGRVLLHLYRALRSEAARDRRRAPAVEPAVVVEQQPRVILDDRFVWADAGIGSVTASLEGPAQSPYLANLVTTSHGVSLDADGCRALARWLLVVADERRPS